MYEELMEQVVTKENATSAWLAVKRNRGAAGIARMTTDGFLMPSDLASPHATEDAAFNRRMRKTARPVAWEG